MRSHLRQYYPAFPHAFADARDGIMRPEAPTILAAAPTPTRAAKLAKSQLGALLRRAGRQRGIDAEAARLQQVFHGEQMRQLPLLEDAVGAQTLALLRALDAACTNANDLADATEHAFSEDPDAEIITSLPGLGRLIGARELAEIGDDRSRFAERRTLTAHAGAAPITRASGKTVTVLHRRVKTSAWPPPATFGHSPR